MRTSKFSIKNSRCPTFAQSSAVHYSAMKSAIPRFKTEKKSAALDAYELLLRYRSTSPMCVQGYLT